MIATAAYPDIVLEIDGVLATMRPAEPVDLRLSRAVTEQPISSEALRYPVTGFEVTYQITVATGCSADCLSDEACLW